MRSMRGQRKTRSAAARWLCMPREAAKICKRRGVRVRYMREKRRQPYKRGAPECERVLMKVCCGTVL